MVTQVNLKFQDSFYELAMEYVEKKGYMNIQELLRESLREKIFENSEIRTEYKKVLASQEANTFHNFEKSKKNLGQNEEKFDFRMREFQFSALFEKVMRKLKGQELRNLISKIDEIISSENIDHYKNLKYDLSKFRRVHVNSSYVILFFDEKEKIYFVDYAHHDVIYKPSKKTLEKYEKVKF